MTALRRSRWAISFADLCLLLLGFFVMLQAGGRGRGNAVVQLSEYFRGQPKAAPMDFPAAQLFEPGEAMLTPSGRATLRRIAVQAAEKQHVLVVMSKGEDASGRRFDRWELAAARLAAAARALREAGFPDERIRINGLQEATEPKDGQHIIICRKETPEGRD